MVSRVGDEEGLSENSLFLPSFGTFYFLICFFQCYGT